MKYKVGDKVRINSIDWYNENKDEDGDVPCSVNTLFVASNKKYLGIIQTIEHVYECKGRYTNNYIYHMTKIDNVDWTDEMIEGLVEEETKPKFKVGDRVITNKGYVGKFEGWVSDYQVRVFFEESGDNVVIHPKNLKLVEKEIGLNKWTGLKVELELSKTVIGVSNVESLRGERFMSGFVKAIIPPEGYQFVDENDNVINTTKIVLEKKKKEYPKTFEECVHVLEGENRMSLGQMNTFRKLIDARNTYWKIAGEEMGLGKPWELSIGTPIYYIYYNRTLGTIKKDYADDIQGNVILAFPTVEMRDAFYENFKDLINECKELL